MPAARLEPGQPVPPLADIYGEPPGRIDRALNRWITIVRGHIVGVHLATALIITGGVNLVLLVAHPRWPQALETIGTESLIVLVSLAFPVSLTLAALRGELRAILALVADGPAPAAPVLLRFVGEELWELQEIVGDLKTQGVLLDQTGISEWVRRRCFVVTRGRYLASDSCIPSLFLDRYRELMAAHAEYVDRTGLTDSVRINVAAISEIEQDRQERPAEYKEYLRWHREHGVVLLHVDKATAIRLASKHRLAQVIDWSLWLGEVALSWDYGGDADGVRMRVCFIGDHNYRRCYSFLRELLQRAQPLDGD